MNSCPVRARPSQWVRGCEIILGPGCHGQTRCIDTPCTICDPFTKRMNTSSLDRMVKRAWMGLKRTDASVLAKMKKHKTLMADVLNTAAMNANGALSWGWFVEEHMGGESQV